MNYNKKVKQLRPQYNSLECYTYREIVHNKRISCNIALNTVSMGPSIGIGRLDAPTLVEAWNTTTRQNNKLGRGSIVGI